MSKIRDITEHVAFEREYPHVLERLKFMDYMARVSATAVNFKRAFSSIATLMYSSRA